MAAIVVAAFGSACERLYSETKSSIMRWVSGGDACGTGALWKMAGIAPAAKGEWCRIIDMIARRL